MPVAPTFSVYGEDGRRVVRNYSEAAAREFANATSNRTGEKLDIRKDDADDSVRAPLDEFGTQQSEDAAQEAEQASGFPSTHADLDKLGKKHNVTFEDGAKVADKQAALAAAGVTVDE